ncbi:DUF1120 domain-containing protein [Pseudomonas edaphica]|jgi:hypothetical protein|uniref:DUF1120 domain-containing protein n=1 Tax=Pseudomonas edaphica TaxID=2006980 RepID=A0A5R8R423_9PSED|nr:MULTISPECIES: DUF1120 domain-containing protein [Pseudomonas]MCF5230238.1 DUF1120 domain-containing protein [Pseudomonas sp. PA-5-4H]MCF5235559.1 DUF1120 domain-containing protein [Pseudomonas sp. PA-5-4G]MCF5248246.1 DUF1120 domain-containing protein [Pseudomonas sp. PA-5-4B]MCF5254296.1 DUF1120 domain-containing protein [Pseudomonas sp. PA-5-4B]MCF5259478.1 DUF1120 domain-containing protein [Pseudomonas sp. PA-5-4A]
MNTRLTTLAVSALLLSSANAFAASSVDLTVKGLIVPSACTPSLSGGGMIDHGKVSAKDLNPDRGTAIGVHTLSMTVDCDAPIQFALHPIDNRAASGLTTDFGLGFINETQKLGHFSLTWRGMVADGVTVQPIASMDQGKTWYSEKFWEPSMYMAAASMSDDTQPLPIQNLSVDLEVLTIINAAASLDLSNEVTIDGSATVEVKYL